MRGFDSLKLSLSLSVWTGTLRWHTAKVSNSQEPYAITSPCGEEATRPLKDNRMDKDKELVAATIDDFSPSLDLAASGPTGFEGITNEDITIPFLKIAQSGTDEAKKGDPNKIEGLEVGQFFCPATRKVYGESIRLIILKFYRQYTIYESRESDAKFMGTMSPEQFKAGIENAPGTIRERSYHLDAEGHRYVDTRNFIVLIAGHYNDGPMLMSLSSTGVAPSKKLMTMASSIRNEKGDLMPIWTSVWELVTGYQTHEKGSYYQITKISRLGWVNGKYVNLVQAAFKDANGMSQEELHASMAKVASSDDEAKSVEGTHAFKGGKQSAASDLGISPDMFEDDKEEAPPIY